MSNTVSKWEKEQYDRDSDCCADDIATQSIRIMVVTRGVHSTTVSLVVMGDLSEVIVRELDFVDYAALPTVALSKLVIFARMPRTSKVLAVRRTAPSTPVPVPRGHYPILRLPAQPVVIRRRGPSRSDS
jgi:hypothetical protein